MTTPPAVTRPTAWHVVLTFGVVSLFADMVYEGARSLYGPALLALGASATVVGLVTGAGEAMALVLRLVAGPTADRRGAHWAFTIAGYGLTAVCVPLLAVSPRLGAAGLVFGAAMILLERAGKAVRSPSKSALLATAARSLGRGTGFGVHKALDQIGAFSGPLLVAGVVALTSSTWLGFAWLAVPGAAAMAVLLLLRRALRAPAGGDGAPADPSPRPSGSPAAPVAAANVDAASSGSPSEAASPTGSTAPVPPVSSTGPMARSRARWRTRLGTDLPPAFLTYALAAGTTTAGLVTFAVISVHLTRDLGLPTATIPLVYAGAMAVEAVAALLAGRCFDVYGPATLLAVPVAVAVVPPLAFGAAPALALTGVAVWGAATGVQDSTIKALVADLVPSSSLATAYGVFAAVQGVFALVGGTAAGFLLDRSVPLLIGLVAASQAVAVVLLLRSLRLGKEPARTSSRTPAAPHPPSPR